MRAQGFADAKGLLGVDLHWAVPTSPWAGRGAGFQIYVAPVLDADNVQRPLALRQGQQYGDTKQIAFQARRIGQDQPLSEASESSKSEDRKGQARLVREGDLRAQPPRDFHAEAAMKNQAKTRFQRRPGQIPFCVCGSHAKRQIH